MRVMRVMLVMLVCKNKTRRPYEFGVKSAVVVSRQHGLMLDALNRYAQEYGQRLLSEIYGLYNPLTYDEARSLEVALGIDLREGGFGVWQA